MSSSELIHRYFDEGLDGPLEDELFEQLAANTEMRREFAEHLRIHALVRSDLANITPPAAVTSALFASIGLAIPAAAAASQASSASSQAPSSTAQPPSAAAQPSSAPMADRPAAINPSRAAVGGEKVWRAHVPADSGTSAEREVMQYVAARAADRPAMQTPARVRRFRVLAPQFATALVASVLTTAAFLLFWPAGDRMTDDRSATPGSTGTLNQSMTALSEADVPDGGAVPNPVASAAGAGQDASSGVRDGGRRLSGGANSAPGDDAERPGRRAAAPPVPPASVIASADPGNDGSGDAKSSSQQTQRNAGFSRDGLTPLPDRREDGRTSPITMLQLPERTDLTQPGNGSDRFPAAARIDRGGSEGDPGDTGRPVRDGAGSTTTAAASTDPVASTASSPFSSLVVEMRVMNSRSYPEVDLPYASEDLFKDMAVSALYKLTDRHAVGVEYGRETFGQIYSSMDVSRASDGTVRGVVNPSMPWIPGVYSENKMLDWVGAAWKLSFPEFGMFNVVFPYARTVLGATREGPLGKLRLGFEYFPTDFSMLNLGVEGSILRYQVEQVWYQTNKLGLSLGLAVVF